MSVNRNMRHTKAHRCPVCDGADQDPRGHSKRCHGFTSADGYAHCSRTELAGSIDQGPDGLFAHRLQGSCKCGQSHGAEVITFRERITYDYRDAAGVLRFQVVRDPGKKFWQRRPDGAGGWMGGRGDSPWLPYRLPELLKADPSKTVFICEGEKDVDTLWRLGAVATCNPCGAGKWRFVEATARGVLEGREVVVLADNDEEGGKHAEDVRTRLDGVAKSVRVLCAPAPHKDVTDLVEAGGGLNDLVGEAAPPVVEKPPEVPAWEKLAPAMPFADIWAPEPELSLVVPAMGLAPGPVHLVTGSWYTGKTLFLLSLGLSIASGRDVFGLWHARQGSWTHFDHEMGRRHMKRYIQRLAAGMNVKPEDVEGRLNLRVLPALNLTTAGAVDHYTKLLEGQTFATFDPLRAATPGQDENASEFRQWLDMLAVVSDRTGCSIGVLHHGGKPQEGSARRNTGRGSSAIDDAVQTKFVLTAEKGAPIQVSHEKTRELNAPLEDFWLVIESGTNFVRLAHKNQEQLTERQDDPLDALKRAIVRAVKGKRPLKSENEIASRVTGRRAAISQAIRELVEDDVIRMVDGSFRAAS